MPQYTVLKTLSILDNCKIIDEQQKFQSCLSNTIFSSTLLLLTRLILSKSQKQLELLIIQSTLSNVGIRGTNPCAVQNLRIIYFTVSLHTKGSICLDSARKNHHVSGSTHFATIEMGSQGINDVYKIR